MGSILKDAAPARRLDASWVQAREDALRLREEAETAARACVEAARAEGEALRAAARERGLEEARAEATSLLASAVIDRDRIIAAAEPELVELAVELARRVVGAAAERDRGVAVASAARALGAVRGRSALTVRVHPDDAAAIRDGEPLLAARLGGRGFLLVSDAAVERGGAVVESDGCTVDARLAPQLDALRGALLEGP